MVAAVWRSSRSSRSSPRSPHSLFFFLFFLFLYELHAQNHQQACKCFHHELMNPQMHITCKLGVVFFHKHCKENNNNRGAQWWHLWSDRQVSPLCLHMDDIFDVISFCCTLARRKDAAALKRTRGEAPAPTSLYLRHALYALTHMSLWYLCITVCPQQQQSGVQEQKQEMLTGESLNRRNQTSGLDWKVAAKDKNNITVASYEKNSKQSNRSARPLWKCTWVHKFHQRNTIQVCFCCLRIL